MMNTWKIDIDRDCTTFTADYHFPPPTPWDKNPLLVPFLVREWVQPNRVISSFPGLGDHDTPIGHDGLKNTAKIFKRRLPPTLRDPEVTTSQNKLEKVRMRLNRGNVHALQKTTNEGLKWKP